MTPDHDLPVFGDYFELVDHDENIANYDVIGQLVNLASFSEVFEICVSKR